jgi:pilus assembly protein CpaE
MSPTILIVDDDLDTLRLVGTTLEKNGFDILAAKDGQQALDMALDEIPDLILLDVMMPKMDGYEVTKRLRADPSTEAIPIIIFTAMAQLEDKVEGLEMGADDYLTKPTHPTELVARVKSHLKRATVAVTRSLSLAEEELPQSVNKSIIGLIAPKGGLGLSSLAINLGVVLNEITSERIVVAEMRPGRGDIGVFLGYQNISTLTDLLTKEAADITRKDVEGSLSSHGSGISFLLSSRTAADAQYNDRVDQMDAIATQLAKISEYTILDLGASLTKGTQGLLKHCDRVVLALEGMPHTVVLARNLIEDLVKLDISRMKIHPVLLNRARTEQAMSVSTVQKELGTDIGTIFTPAPELANQAAALQKPMVLLDSTSFTKQQVTKLAEALV